MDQPIRLKSKPASAIRILKSSAYTALSVVAGWLLYLHFSSRPLTDVTEALWFALGFAIYAVVEIIASRTRMTVSIEEGRVTIQTGSLVTGSFSLDDIRLFEPDVTVPQRVLPTPIRASRITTRANLVFYIPSGSFSQQEESDLHALLASHANPHS